MLGSTPIKSQRHRRARRLFVVIIDLTDTRSGSQLVALTKDLSEFGCFVKTVTPFSECTKVRVRISHAGVNFVALGKVTHSRPNSGMGIAFVTIEPTSRPVLLEWLAT
jgi:PilZ domain-containing protein